jgi:hypothetical protein
MLMTTRNCWLHVLASRSLEGMSISYTLIGANAPDLNGEGGSMPFAAFPSWDVLRGQLKSIGIHDAALENAKLELDSIQCHTFCDISLSTKQTVALGLLR